MKTLILIIIILSLLSCQKQNLPNTNNSSNEPSYSSMPAITKKTAYVFSINPIYSQQKVFELMTPFIKRLNVETPEGEFILETATDYADYEEKLKTGRYHISMANPLQALMSIKHGYKIIGKIANDRDQRGLILLRKDSKIKNFSDLKGKRVAYPSPTALSACMLPQYLFAQHGINVQKDLTNVYVGSQDSSIMAVASGHTDVGTTWPPSWATFKKSHPLLAERLKVQWETPHLINGAVIVREDLPEVIVLHLTNFLFSLHTNREGQHFLKRAEISGFEPSTNREYKKIEHFLEEFHKKVLK